MINNAKNKITITTLLIAALIASSLFFAFSNYIITTKKLKIKDQIIQSQKQELQELLSLKQLINKDNIDVDLLNIDYISNNYIILTKEDLRLAIKEFISTFSNIEDEDINDVAETFVKLYYNAEHKQNVLYYLALCSVESNFDMNAKSHTGAVGIAQIMYNIWGKNLKENYSISKDQVYYDTYYNVFAGFMIWRHYWQRNNYNNKLANYGYLGAQSINYHNKITSRYAFLSNLILKRF